MCRKRAPRTGARFFCARPPRLAGHAGHSSGRLTGGETPNESHGQRRRAGWGLILSIALTASASASDLTYIRGAAGEPETLDPQRTATVAEADIVYDLFEGLLTYDAAGALVPGVALSWTISPDGLAYVFVLRDAKWSNGESVTAGDFVYAFRRLLSPVTSAQYANLFYVLKNGEAVAKGAAPPEALGVKALDDRRLEIDLERPTPYFLGLLAHQTAVPVNPRNVETFGQAFTKPGNLVGNGAYRLTGFTPNDRITLERNPYFHDAAKVRIAREDIVPLEDRSAALRRFEAGEIDSYPDAPADQIPYIRARFGAAFHLTPSLGVFYLAVNTAKAPFDDARVRNALSMALDREFLAERIWGGAMIPAYGFVPPGIDNYGPPVTPAFASLAPIDAEDEAKALLAKAGFGAHAKPLTVEIRYNTSENNKATAVAIADMWRAVGVETRFVNTDAKTHFALLRDGGDFDVARAGWLGDYSDPQNFLALAKSGNAGLNYSHYANPAYDSLLDQAETERDLPVRAKILAEAEAILLRDQPVIPLMFASSRNLVSPKVTGWKGNILDRHLTRYLDLER